MGGVYGQFVTNLMLACVQRCRVIRQIKAVLAV